jgi:Flp pilus assembly pilin Flp
MSRPTGVRAVARSWRGHTARLLSRLVREDDGQDIIEYVLLTAAVGVVSIAIWPLIETAIRTSYEALDTDTQNLWEPPDPSGGGA